GPAATPDLPRPGRPDRSRAPRRAGDPRVSRGEGTAHHSEVGEALPQPAVAGLPRAPGRTERDRRPHLADSTGPGRGQLHPAPVAEARLFRPLDGPRPPADHRPRGRTRPLPPARPLVDS